MVSPTIVGPAIVCPAAVRPAMVQLNIGPINTATIATIYPIADQLNIRPIDRAYSHYSALHWIDKQVSFTYIKHPHFQACCMQGDIILPLFKPLPPYL